MTYFGSKLFNPGMLNGLGNRVVANITSSVGGQALLNTLGGTLVDTGTDTFVALLKQGIKKNYDPKAKGLTEQDVQKLVYTSLVSNLVLNGMQNLIAYSKGMTGETEPSKAEREAMMGQVGGEARS